MRCARLRRAPSTICLKPFDNTRFELALERAKGRVEAAKIAPRKVERIAVKSAGQVVFVKIAEIDWIEAADYYVALHVGGKAHLLRRSMAELEEELEPSVFCRIHRSTMVNLDRVPCLGKRRGGRDDCRFGRRRTAEDEPALSQGTARTAGCSRAVVAWLC